MYNINDFEMLEPMKYYNNETDNQKRRDMINNANDEYMATVKKDGDWAMLIHYEEGHNLIRSRSISKVTGKYGDYTEKLPQICDVMDKLPDNTVLLAEICWDEPGTNANTVGTILRCLPPKAIERQKDKKLKALVFDCLMADGEDYTSKRYDERFNVAAELVEDYVYPSRYMYMTQLCVLDEYHENFMEWSNEIINNGGEGVVIQRKDNPYMPGTRTAWKTLKLKQKLPELELLVIGTIDPKKEYEGNSPESWPYEVDGVKVTKPYYYSWKNGITVAFNGTTCDVTSGLTDEDREWLASPDAEETIAAKGLYAVVGAMSINELGRLRHPVLIRLRTEVVEE